MVSGILNLKNVQLYLLLDCNYNGELEKWNGYGDILTIVLPVITTLLKWNGLNTTESALDWTLWLENYHATVAAHSAKMTRQQRIKRWPNPILFRTNGSHNRNLLYWRYIITHPFKFHNNKNFLSLAFLANEMKKLNSETTQVCNFLQNPKKFWEVVNFECLNFLPFVLK